MKSNFIRKLIRRLRFPFLAHRREISLKGEYYANYIINKYINQTNPEDYIENYEEMITRNEDRVRKMNIFDALYKSPEGEEDNEMLHFLAANFALGFLLMSIIEKETQKYLDMITDPRARHFINVICHPNKKINN